MPPRGTRVVGGYLLAVVALAAVYYATARLGLSLAYLELRNGSVAACRRRHRGTDAVRPAAVARDRRR